MASAEVCARIKGIRDNVLEQLKPFQRKTVLHIERLFEDGVQRVLVADEVGLGKTLVARGVVAAAAHLHVQERPGDLFKVVYVCSNSGIVNQNLAKLSIDEGLVDRVDAEEARLSMQHFSCFKNERRALEANAVIQLIPLTPGTSFNISSTGGSGTCRERALVYAVLRRHSVFAPVLDRLEDLFRSPAKETWPWQRSRYEDAVASEPGYIDEMLGCLTCSQDAQKTLGEVAAYLSKRTQEDKVEDRAQIAKLRQAFALLSIERLKPDLVIMDEFQRFRGLLEADDSTDLGLVAKRFLSSSKDGHDPRVLLLSATPFKPFSTRAEDEVFFGDASEQDFLRVVGFLSEDGSEFKNTWHEYGGILQRYAEGRSEIDEVEVKKTAAEDGLRRLMVRTERAGMIEYGDVIRDCTADEHIGPTSDDVAVQVGVRVFCENLGEPPLPIDYAESCPFVLSYLKGYKTAERLRKSIADHPEALPSNSANHRWNDRLWVRFGLVSKYKELPIPNSRFSKFMDDVFAGGNGFDPSSLLWVPASRPYYRVGRGPFEAMAGFSKTLLFSSWAMVPRMVSTILSYEDERRSVSRPYYRVGRGPFEAMAGFSKTLLFSSWAMVPRMVSTILSYEDERRSVMDRYGEGHGYSYFDKNAEIDMEESEGEGVGGSDTESKSLPSNRLIIKPAAEKGSVLLLYPSRALASLVGWPETGDSDVAGMVAKTKAEIETKLSSVLGNGFAGMNEGQPDLRWYPRAVLELEKAMGFEPEDFFASIEKEGGDTFRSPEREMNEGQPDLRWYPRAVLELEKAMGFEPEDFFASIEKEGGDTFRSPERDLIGAWRRTGELPIDELGTAPRDLCEVLAEMAIASPAVCALRTFGRCQRSGRSKGLDHEVLTQNLAYRFALAFRRKLDTPSATLAVESGCRNEALPEHASHWSRVLRYCMLGNFQSVLDEYAHQLGYHRHAEAVCADMIGGDVSTFKGPSLYTMQSHYEVDTLKSYRSAREPKRKKPKRRRGAMSMRTGFAAAFIEDEGGGSNNTNRRDNLRRAFNSPFRPFVLASTSVGQEGLDFHAYCRKIVHWNMPSNPVDLEQREGRINRYESFAIRQNIARRYPVPLKRDEDIWEKMFLAAGEDARQRFGDGLSGLVPHWGLPSYGDDDPRIERHAYLRKFGLAEQRYDHLIDVLVRYRAVLGQPRQEELLAKLGDKLDRESIKRLFIMLAPFNLGCSLCLRRSILIRSMARKVLFQRANRLEGGISRLYQWD